jgi:hypothetical protein
MQEMNRERFNIDFEMRESIEVVVILASGEDRRDME